MPGVGPKTAVTLLNSFGTVDGVLEHAQEARGAKVQKALTEYRDQAILSRDLAVIHPDVPDMPELAALAYHAPSYESVKEVFTHHGFASLLKLSLIHIWFPLLSSTRCTRPGSTSR